MGVPMIQVFLILARQMSKPISDRIMGFGRKHPYVRNHILIPIGTGITNFSTRLRLKNLGLTKPTQSATVSEEVALEQASETIQQAVIFFYSVSLYALYNYYSKKGEKETATREEIVDLLEKVKKLETNKLWMEERILRLEEHLAKKGGSSGLLNFMPKVGKLELYRQPSGQTEEGPKLVQQNNNGEVPRAAKQGREVASQMQNQHRTISRQEAMEILAASNSSE